MKTGEQLHRGRPRYHCVLPGQLGVVQRSRMAGSCRRSLDSFQEFRPVAPPVEPSVASGGDGQAVPDSKPVERFARPLHTREGPAAGSDGQVDLFHLVVGFRLQQSREEVLENLAGGLATPAKQAETCKKAGIPKSGVTRGAAPAERLAIARGRFTVLAFHKRNQLLDQIRFCPGAEFADRIVDLGNCQPCEVLLNYRLSLCAMWRDGSRPTSGFGTRASIALSRSSLPNSSNPNETPPT